MATLGPRLPSPADWVANQVAAATAAADKWLKNTLAPRRDPTAAAIAAKSRWATKVQEAVTQDRFAKGLAQVDEAEKEATIKAVGAQGGFAQGVQARAGKALKKITKLHGLLMQNLQVIDGMPDNTEAERDAKVLANLKAMRGLKAKMRA